MNPQEDNNPYQTPQQPQNTPGGMPQPGVEPQSPSQSGVFVGGQGVSGAQAPWPQPPQPQTPQPYPQQPGQHPAYPSDPTVQPTAQPHQPFAHPQQQPQYQSNPGQHTAAPQAHDTHGNWQPPTQSSSSYPTHGGQNTKLIVTIAAIVFILLLGVGIFFVMKGDNPVSNLTNSIAGNSDDVVDRSDGTLDLSNLIDPVDTIKSQDITAKLNQQINLSDGSSYMVTSVERNWTNPDVKASSGKELIKVNVVVGNKSKEGGLYFSDNFFRLKNSAGGLQDSEYVSEDEVPDALVGGEVAPGKQKKGAIIYEVDKDEQLGGLVTEDTYTKSGSDDEIVIKSLVTF